MKIRHLCQGAEEKSCGLYSTAMVTGREVSDIANVIGHAGSTSIHELTKAATKLGYGDGSFQRVEFDEPKDINISNTGILILCAIGAEQAHAVAFHGGTIYDPDNNFPFAGIENILRDYNCTAPSGVHWIAGAVIRMMPVRTREFAVGNSKIEEEE
ncbi:MAG: hypothetical protein LC650_03465 [Actinobacteria bacterium]|nr:hypothetical protein [Actinomycetota bacterium]